MRRTIIPCPLCGYDAPGTECPHCGLTSREPSLAAPQKRAWSSWIDGLRAMPMGLFHIVTSPRVWPLLVPPVVITTLLFGGLLWWGWSRIERFFAAVREQSLESLNLQEGWWRDALMWLMERAAIVALAKATGFLLFLVVCSILVLWIFSIVYEALSGPFLDEAQGRIETRWFGSDPRKTLERPRGLSEKHVTWMTLGCGAISATAILATLFDPSRARWIWLACSPLSFVTASVVDRPYGAWLRWLIRTEISTLFVSLKASLLAGFVLVAFIWLKFVPGIGFILFAAVAGFSTAISLLDIPFSRRRYSFRQRCSFLARHAIPITTFGAVASVFFIVPIFGPLFGVPAASLGGQWLVCRLDKRFLRPIGQRDVVATQRDSLTATTS